MRIAMIGHKRYGSREGGVEVVVTELARRMAALGGSLIVTGVPAQARKVFDAAGVPRLVTMQ